MIHSASHIHLVTKTNHSCVEQALRTPLPVNDLAPREAVVNVRLANHASPVRLVELKRLLACRQISKNLPRVPFSVERATEMQPHRVNMHVLGEYNSRLCTTACLTSSI